MQEVEDLTAETFFRAWKARAHFEGDEQSVIAWLLTIARHLVIDSVRRKYVRRVERSYFDIDESLSILSFEPLESTEGNVIKREQITILLHQLSSLPCERRELLVLRYFMGWPVKQIASHLGMVENTASVYIRRAIEHIRKNWPGDDL